MSDPKQDFLFVDESGDPGYGMEQNSGRLLSSPFFVLAALHLCDDSIPQINRHVAALRYLRSFDRELKLPAQQQYAGRLLGPIGQLAQSHYNVWASVVYVDKEQYTGRYLKPTPEAETDPLRFRNYVLRRLLQHHFSLHPLQSNQYDLVLDRVDMTAADRENLTTYLRSRPDIPPPTYVTHASSIYVEGLQVVHNIANSYYDSLRDGHDLLPELSFVAASDISTDRLGTQ